MEAFGAHEAARAATVATPANAHAYSSIITRYLLNEGDLQRRCCSQLGEVVAAERVKPIVAGQVGGILYDKRCPITQGRGQVGDSIDGELVLEDTRQHRHRARLDRDGALAAEGVPFRVRSCVKQQCCYGGQWRANTRFAHRREVLEPTVRGDARSEG